MFKEPNKLTQNSMGFDSEVMPNIMYRNTNKRLKRRDKTNPISKIEQI